MAVVRVLRNIRSAAWLGWQIESNWADPFLFIVYSVAKPVASSLILVFMYLIVLGGDTSTPFFAYMFSGNAFFIYVGQLLIGIGWVIFEDREHYETLKYVYVSPQKIVLYLFGRGTIKFLTATLAVAITLAFGIIALRVPVHTERIMPFHFAASFVLGIIGIAALGIILAAIGLLVARHSMSLNEGVAGLFYLLSGAVFPIDVLPGWVRGFSKSLPFTYWLEGIRRSLGWGGVSKELGSIPDGRILLILLVTTVCLFFFALWFYAVCERIARRYGLIDRTTNY
ncbi:MAG: ABC transporter permease [Candidatus Eisenbacteria bacterium]|nr:ABC transporter permease [Candidatus Eisenbacteria bacterium]